MKKISFLLLAFIIQLLAAKSYSQVTPNQIPETEFTKLIPCGTSSDYFKSLGITLGIPAAPGGGGLVASATNPDVFPAYAIVQCGKFAIYYEDLIIGNPLAGYSDPINGLARRNTLCAVLTYVQSVFDFSNIPVGSPIKLHVNQSFDAITNPAPVTVGYLAVAGPTFINTGVPHIIYGFVRDYTVSGIDPATPAQYHAALTTNFDQAYDAFGNSIEFEWHDDYTLPIPNCNMTYFLFYYMKLAIL